MKTHIVIHHSLTKDGETVSWGAVRRYHMAQMGFRDIGYHVGFEMIDDHYEALLGRPLLDKAAAAYQENMNRVGVHCLFMGNFDEHEPTAEILAFGAKHIAAIAEALRIEPHDAYILPHSRVANYKTCPGKLFPMDEFIKLVEREM